MACDSLETRLDLALEARRELLDGRRQAALRLFNGFSEGCPELVVDLYARTLVLFNYADPPEQGMLAAQTAQALLRDRLPWTQALVLKSRFAKTPEQRSGVLVWGEQVDRRVREDGVWYRAELMLNQDASLYLDTRNLRRWARQRLAGKTVLNTFAYTGSLGVAAAAGGASRVVQTDRSRAFLNIAKDSCALNGLPVNKSDFISDDFFSVTSRLRRSGAQFDCVFVDPPFFSATTGGRVDLVGESQRVLNKVRPLVASGGWLAAVNNALFISGADYLNLLEAQCADGYLSIEELLTVPPDCTGFPETIVRSPPVDPAPFNHSTKIAILRVQRKGS